MKEETLRFLGLLRKGGNLIIGKAVESAVPKCSLIVIASDAGEAVAKAISDKAAHYHKRVYVASTKTQLGEALGYPELSAIAILHPKAAKKVLALEEIAPQKGEL